MTQYIMSIALLINSLCCFSQPKKNFSVQLNYGLNGNFFVRSYDEVYGPPLHVYFFKKNFLGTISGIDLAYSIKTRSYLLAGYSRSINLGKKNYLGTINGVDIYIRDFQLKHVNNIYQLGYGRNIKVKNSILKLEAGPVLIYDAKQTLEIESYFNLVRIDESNFKNDNSVEGGVFFGVGWIKKIDTKFDLGIKSRIYYLISTSSLEAVTFTPVLVYNF
jgi:hypothetical protein